jgi:hypothetical protein
MVLKIAGKEYLSAAKNVTSDKTTQTAATAAAAATN